MGLAITQKIMVDHGGKIEMKTKHGEGTTFFLIFPRKT
jgi:signal transduction histidine kinase